MIDVIIIGVVALAALGVVTFVVVKLLGVIGELNAARDLYEKQREVTDDVVRDRDALTVQLAVERDKTKALLDRLSTAESERNNATRALAAKVGKAIQDAPDAAAALDALNDLLSAHLPGTGQAGASAAGGHGGEAAAVHAAAPAGTVPAGGHA